MKETGITAAIKDTLRQMPLFAQVADEQKLLQLLEQGTEIWLH